MTYKERTVQSRLSALIPLPAYTYLCTLCATLARRKHSPTDLTLALTPSPSSSPLLHPLTLTPPAPQMHAPCPYSCKSGTRRRRRAQRRKEDRVCAPESNSIGLESTESNSIGLELTGATCSTNWAHTTAQIQVNVSMTTRCY